MPDEDCREPAYNLHERELADKAIYNFQAERLRSYFVENGNIAKPALNMLEEANTLQKDGHSQAAFLFYVSAVEIAIKEAVVKPIVHGLVHEVAAAELIAALIPRELGSDNFGKLLFGVLNKIRKARNDLIHAGVPV